MQTLSTILKAALCLYGGIVSLSLVFLIGTNIRFGLHEAAQQAQFVQRWIGLVWAAGFAFGGGVAYRSLRHGSRKLSNGTKEQ